MARRRKTGLRGRPEEHEAEWLRTFRKAADLAAEAANAPSCSFSRLEKTMEAMRWVGLAQANLFFAGPLQKSHEERNDRTTAAWRALDRLTQRLDDGILDYGDSCLPGDAPMTSMFSGGRRGRR